MVNDNTLITGMINRIQEAIDSSPIPRVGSANRRIVDVDEIFDMLVELKTSLPENVRRANGVILEADKIIDDAEEHAKGLVDDAAARADDMVAKAERDADKLIRDANEYFDRKTEEADLYYEHRYADGDRYYEDKIADAEAEASRIIAEAEATRANLISESEITLAATEQAEELRRKTVMRSNQVYMNAKRSADKVLEELMNYLEEYYAAIKTDREALDVKPAATEARYDSQSRAQRGPTRPQSEAEQYQEDEEAEESVSIFNFFKRKRRSSDEWDEQDENDND
ncbi:MAG: hypothetical protein J1E60_04585 [Christensenellaceae bacterium]|nr:hypothetical protein [Christensenellaceae bacterium]